MLCSLSVCILWIHCILYMGPLSPYDSDRVSGPNGSGSRSTSGDTGEGEHAASKGHIN